MRDHHNVPATIIDRVVATIEAEAMEFVQLPPETLRSEFGFGRAHGILRTVLRFKELLDIELEEMARKQEADDDTL